MSSMNVAIIKLLQMSNFVTTKNTGSNENHFFNKKYQKLDKITFFYRLRTKFWTR